MNSITVKHLSKSYPLQYKTKKQIALRTLITDTLSSFSKKPHEQKPFFALQDISFSVKKGEVVGIIGANGSGKSTLLRLIASITPPSSGSITLAGTVVPLFTLGLGFHPDLTGRENITLNAALLGYDKRKVHKEIPHIIAFSQLEKFIDVPVKYYSSGMYARLGFAIATANNLEPDILLVDEGLTVGDAAFHKKAFARMKTLAKNKKTTIIIVSHDLASLEQLCSSCLWVEKGRMKLYAQTRQVLTQYKQSV